ncbi:portal protein, partial [Sphingomonas adhaesiva]|uniref:portal protein n=1 Tax=Sphingomonas adhaesiva TaxID=28212 RepID=UPI0035C75F3A
MGYLRVRSDYLADDSFEQDLIIDHIENQFAVTMDPNAKERDRSDMNWCLIDDTMEKEAFKELYPDANADPVNSDSVDDMGTWYSDNSVKISEYFTREPCIKEVALLSDGRSVYMDELEPVVDELLAKGVSIVRTRKVKTYKVFWRKITGLDVLEGPVELPCSTIPVVPVWGKALVIKKKIIFRSIVRHSKDAVHARRDRRLGKAGADRR